MSIKLEYLILRNKKTIQEFLKNNKIESYESLLLFCEERDCLPISRKDFEVAISAFTKKEKDINLKSENKKEDKKTVRKTAKPTKRKATTATRKRTSTRKTSTSKTQKTKSSRDSD